MQCLLGSIFHSGNSERRIVCRLISGCKHVEEAEIDSPTLEFMYCLCLLLRVSQILGPRLGFLTLFSVTRRTARTLPLYEWSADVVRLVPCPSTCLRRLHDTHLESANVAVDGSPVKAVPFRRRVRRTNSLRCRHLLCLICRLPSSLV